MKKQSEVLFFFITFDSVFISSHISTFMLSSLLLSFLTKGIHHTVMVISCVNLFLSPLFIIKRYFLHSLSLPFSLNERSVVLDFRSVLFFSPSFSFSHKWRRETHIYKTRGITLKKVGESLGHHHYDYHITLAVIYARRRRCFSVEKNMMMTEHKTLSGRGDEKMKSGNVRISQHLNMSRHPELGKRDDDDLMLWWGNSWRSHRRKTMHDVLVSYLSIQALSLCQCEHHRQQRSNKTLLLFSHGWESRWEQEIME